jgi:hypothetical protein
VPLVEEELLTLPEHLSSLTVFSAVRVTRSLVLYVCFEDRCLSFCTFSLGHCVVYSSSIYGFWLPLWYPQTLLYQYKVTLDQVLSNVEQMKIDYSNDLKHNSVLKKRKTWEIVCLSWILKTQWGNQSILLEMYVLTCRVVDRPISEIIYI